MLSLYYVCLLCRSSLDYSLPCCFYWSRCHSYCHSCCHSHCSPRVQGQGQGQDHLVCHGPFRRSSVESSREEQQRQSSGSTRAPLAIRSTLFSSVSLARSLLFSPLLFSSRSFPLRQLEEMQIFPREISCGNVFLASNCFLFSSGHRSGAGIRWHTSPSQGKGLTHT